MEYIFNTLILLSLGYTFTTNIRIDKHKRELLDLEGKVTDLILSMSKIPPLLDKVTDDWDEFEKEFNETLDSFNVDLAKFDNDKE